MAKTKSVAMASDKSVQSAAQENDSKKMENAAFICGSVFAAHRVMDAVDGKGWLRATNEGSVIKYLRDQAVAVQSGDLSQAESMLMNQATALQSLFVHLAEQGIGQTLRANIELFMKLALRAQNQCRATLETLATIKNPPNVAFVKQANISNGPQQVNNGAEASPARENKIEQTQLLEVIPNERLDFGTTEKAIGNDQIMEPVEAINRAENRGRKTGECKARL